MTCAKATSFPGRGRESHRHPPTPGRQTKEGHCKLCLWGPESQNKDKRAQAVTQPLSSCNAASFFDVNRRWRYTICIFIEPTARWTMFMQSPRAIEWQWMLLPGKVLTSPCTSPHLNTWILLTSARWKIRLQKGIQPSFEGVGRTRKNLEKWIIVRGISLFSATPGQSSNLKTNLEKRTKRNSINLQRKRGKNSLASSRSFQTINNNKKKE